LELAADTVAINGILLSDNATPMGGHETEWAAAAAPTAIIPLFILQ